MPHYNAPVTKKLKETPNKFYKLEKIRVTRMLKYKSTNTTYKATIQNLELPGIKEILKALHTIFSSLLDEVTQFAEDQDLIRFSVQSNELDYPIQIPFRKKKELNVESFLSEIERVLQSFEQFVLDGSFEIDIIHVKVPQGKGRNGMVDVNLDKYLQEKRCFVKINNKDELCCARALITAKARLDNHPLYSSIRHGRGIQTILPKRLHEDACVEEGVCGLTEIKKFQAFLTDYQIVVVSKENFNAIVFLGNDVEKRYTSSNMMTILM